jgi:hypothetical protein
MADMPNEMHARDGSAYEHAAEQGLHDTNGPLAHYK